MPHCKYCFCTPYHACALTLQGEIVPCWWVIEPQGLLDEGVCSNPECVKKEFDACSKSGWPTVEDVNPCASMSR